MAKATLRQVESEARPAERPGPDFPPGVAYVDGRYCPISEAKISVLDWGFLRSDATYDVVHVWQRRFFRLDKSRRRDTAGHPKRRAEHKQRHHTDGDQHSQREGDDRSHERLCRTLR